MFIYLVRNKVNGKGYVGQTISSVAHRWNQHKTKAFRSDKSYPPHKAMVKYGVAAFDVVQLAQATTLDELNRLERAYIVQYGTMAPRGYNLTDGGDNYKRSDETRARMSAAKRGNRFCRGRVVPQEQRDKIAASLRGHVVSEKARETAGRLGRLRRKYHSPEEVRLARSASSKRAYDRRSDGVRLARNAKLRAAYAKMPEGVRLALNAKRQMVRAKRKDAKNVTVPQQDDRQ